LVWRANTEEIAALGESQIEGLIPGLKRWLRGVMRLDIPPEARALGWAPEGG